jgi:hypothetical protein
MRSNYPLSSLEINDIVYRAYEDLTYLLSYENASGVMVSGYLDKLDDSISNLFLSGVLSLNDREDITTATDYGELSGYMDIADFLKMDYIHRKYYQTEE